VNCIIWLNSDDLDGCSATYSCISDCNDLGDPNETHNICSNPSFIDDPNDPNNPNNYHLGPDSPCIDTGDPDFNEPNETDIDGEDRLVDGDANGTATVDMGADEYYWSRADFNRDLIVNFTDYAFFADNWQKTDDANDYNDIFDLQDNNAIDYNDLGLFCDDWLWQAPWPEGFTTGFGRGAGLMHARLSALPHQPQPTAHLPELQEADIEDLLNWLEELWLDEEVQKCIPEDEWLKFIELVKSQL